MVTLNYQRALELDPTIVEARVGLAFALLHHWNRKNPYAEQNDRYIADALDAAPDNPILHYRLSSYYSPKSNFPLIIQHITKTIELLPEHAAELTFQRGELHFRNGDHDSARADFVKAHELGHPEKAVRQALSHLAR